MRTVFLLATACALTAAPAQAHVRAGARVFPVTLTFDDPGVGDEASLPSFTYTRAGANGGTGPVHSVTFGFEYDKTITPDTALILNDGYNVVDTEGSGTETGWQNLYLTGKWQAITNDPHEFVGSLGIIREFGRSGTTHTGDDQFGSTTPTLYFGKGLGDLPTGLFRPLAITGELGYTIADKELKLQQPVPLASLLTTPFNSGLPAQYNNGNNNAWAGSVSIQYSLPYLQSQVRDIGLPSTLGNMIPIVELDWTSPASSPSAQGTTWRAAPGVIYLAGWGEIGLEALIPLNKTAGTNVGVVGLVHFFFDDLYPHSLGAPLFP